MGLLANIYKANSRIDKSNNIAIAREKVEVLRLYLRL
jgi:hypothetical protein